MTMEMNNNLLIQKAKKKRFNIIRGKMEITELVDRLPQDGECFKFVSTGGFSSASFILFVAERTKIENLHVSTFHVGKKEARLLHGLKQRGQLGNVSFTVCSLMKKDGCEYGYFDFLEQICKANGWTIKVQKNHSKVFLFDTDSGKFVLETSSNLNENPKMEQFSFEKDTALYDFYMGSIFAE